MLARKIRPTTFEAPKAWLCRTCQQRATPHFAPIRQSTRNISYNSEAAARDGPGRNRNPMDYVNNPEADKAYRAGIYRRMKFLGGGLALCLLAQYLVISAMPSTEELEKRKRTREAANGQFASTAPAAQQPALTPSFIQRDKTDTPNNVAGEFQGKPVQVIGGGAKLIAHDEKTGEDLEIVPTGTSTIPHFPKTIKVPTADSVNAASDTEYTLVGLGIRTVSFLSIQVYVVGMYVQTSSLAPLQARLVKNINPTASALIPDEKEKLKNGLLEADYSYELWNELLKDTAGQIKTAFRIVPTRNTDFGHLKDGWVRGITAKTQQATSKGNTTEFNDDSFGASMKEFKSLFQSGGKAPKGSTVLLVRDQKGTLDVYYQQKETEGRLEQVGKIDDERIARLIWLGYLGGKTVSCEGARKSVADGLMELVERPIGSVETMVL